MFTVFDRLTLARMQFAFTISFHFIFPSFSIGLASYLAVLEALWLRTGKPVYLDLFPLLAEDLCGGLCHGCRFATYHVLPVRYQLVGVFKQGWRRDRAADGL